MEIRRKPPNPKIRVENLEYAIPHKDAKARNCLLYTSPSPRDIRRSRMPSSA